MMIFLILMLVAVVAALVIIVLLQGATIRNYQELDRLYQIRVAKADQERHAAEAVIKVQEQRYHLMWDVRRLNEQRIFALSAACNAMAAWINANPGPGGRPPSPEGADDADWWKRGGSAGQG